MSISEEQELLLSQLVDGELPVDEANRVLAGALDELGHVLVNSDACGRLKTLLQLRLVLSAWREQEPPRAIVATLKQSAGTSSHSSRPLLSLAMAAMLGGILVTGGFLLGRQFNATQHGGAIARRSDDSSLQSQMQITSGLEQKPVIVTLDERREIAEAFSLHESVVGPLSWYAADDSTILVAPAEKGEKLQQPIAVVLRLTPSQSTKSNETKTYVIVCRNSDPAAIELPRTILATAVRLRLLSSVTDKGVNLQYVIAAEGTDTGPDIATLAGHRHLGLGQTSLGQLALDDHLVNVDASAWVIRN